MDNNELKAENARLTAMLLDYWGEFGCVESDNGKFREKAFALVESELRAITNKYIPLYVGEEDVGIKYDPVRGRLYAEKGQGTKTLIEAINELKAEQSTWWLLEKGSTHG